jgi:methyl-accepting chemotaxis protein
MTINDVSGSVTNVQIGQTGYAFLLDSTGKVIAHPKREYVETLKDMSQHAAFLGASDLPKRRAIYTNEQGRPVLGYARKSKYGWTLVVQQDAAEAYALIAEANRNALVLLALTLLFVGLVAFLFAQQLTRPIRSLTRTADEISRGNLKAAINEVNRSDEIGALARTIDRMRASIKVAMERLAPVRDESASATRGVWRQPSVIDRRRPAG